MLSDAVVKVVEDVSSFIASPTNLITPEIVRGFNVNDFKTELLSKIEGKVELRQERSARLPVIVGPRKCFMIFIIDTFGGFLQIYEKISANVVRFDGYYVIVLTSGKIPEVDEIFQLSWKIHIYNIVVLFENERSISAVTFMPFSFRNCNDTTPVLIDEFRDGKFVNDVRNLFPKKMKNMFSCSVRVALSRTAEPAVFVENLSNGSYKLSGRDITLMETLSQSMNFAINYSYIGQEGYFYENGTSEGPLRVLLDRNADLVISDCWLKANRLKFFESTTSYVGQNLVFVIPPGRELTSIEKLIYPFALSVWFFVIISFLVGFFVIFVVKQRSKAVQNFVFGSAVKTPNLYLFIGFIGGSQNILPQRNFARFLLMALLMYSLVMRSVYQGSFYQLVHSDKHHNEIQSIDEIIEKDYKIFIFNNMVDLFEGTESIIKK